MPAPRSRYDPTDRYEVRQAEGWTVVVNKRFLADQPKLAEETLARLAPATSARSYGRCRPRRSRSCGTIHVWVEEKEPHHPCMAYHPDPGWLREHDMNPDKARCVELANARNFLEWVQAAALDGSSRAVSWISSSVSRRGLR